MGSATEAAPKEIKLTVSKMKLSTKLRLETDTKYLVAQEEVVAMSSELRKSRSLSMAFLMILPSQTFSSSIVPIIMAMNMTVKMNQTIDN